MTVGADATSSVEAEVRPPAPKKTRNRRSKEEIQKEAEEKRSKEEKAAWVEKTVREYERKGAEVFSVLFRDSIRKGRHHILHYKKTLLFVEHGLATLPEMHAEWLLSERKHDAYQPVVTAHGYVYDLDLCYHFMLELLDPKHEHLVYAAREYKVRGKYKFTQHSTDIWGNSTLSFLGTVQEKRGKRAMYHLPTNCPVHMAIPFYHSVADRSGKLINSIVLRLKEKEEAVLGRLTSYERVGGRLKQWERYSYRNDPFVLERDLKPWSG